MTDSLLNELSFLRLQSNNTTMEKSTLTQKNYACVYNETTKPKKPKRRDKSDLGPDFVAPDGGWGWVICLAAGLNNVSVIICQPTMLSCIN